MPNPSLGHRSLLVSAVLVGLTPLIPVPLLDDAVKSYIERRMVRAIGAAHGVELDKPTVSALVDDVDRSLLRSIAMGVITFPAKLLFRKLFVVLEVKRASDVASRAYHRGYLLDRALASGAMAPHGKHSAREIRAALDAATADSHISPLGGLMRSVFQRSTDVLEVAGKGLVGKLRKKKSGLGEQAVQDAVDDAAAAGPVATIAQRLEAALSALPAGHFNELEARFEQALAQGNGVRR
jgi:hypothetical protein